MTRIYWVAQGAFVALLVSLQTIPGARPPAIVLLTLVVAIQFAVVTWRLWPKRAWRWIAIVPPLSTAALWLALAPWAAAEVGGDGRGLLGGLVMVVWILLAYIGLALWAGFQRADLTKRS